MLLLNFCLGCQPGDVTRTCTLFLTLLVGAMIGSDDRTSSLAPDIRIGSADREGNLMIFFLICLQKLPKFVNFKHFYT